MRLSLRHRFLFIAVPRTASTNMRLVLDPYSEMAGTTADDVSGEDGRFNYHVSAAQMRSYCLSQQLPWEALFKFGFVRNPFDRLASMYRLAVQFQDRAASPAFFDVAERVRGQGSFGAYVRDVWHLPVGQVNYLCDGDGRIMVDFVGRYENVAHDFALCCERIGVASASLPAPVTDGSDFGAPPPSREVAYYDDPETRRTVAEFYAKDFEVFGYDAR